MNAARRKRLAIAVEYLESASAILEEVKDEESDAFDNMPESLQSSENGEKMEENVSNLEEWYDTICDIMEELQTM